MDRNRPTTPDDSNSGEHPGRVAILALCPLIFDPGFGCLDFGISRLWNLSISDYFDFGFWITGASF
jgi:hypothetical protein